MLLVIAATRLSAQTQFKLDANTVVKDSSGNIYPHAIWQKLLQNNLAGLKPVNPKDPNTAFILYLFTEEQKARSEKLRAQREANAPKPAESKFLKQARSCFPLKKRILTVTNFPSKI